MRENQASRVDCVLYVLDAAEGFSPVFSNHNRPVRHGPNAGGIPPCISPVIVKKPLDIPNSRQPEIKTVQT